MKKVISVRFKENGKSYYFDPAGAEIRTGDYVIVETARGIECGEVVQGVRELTDAAVPKAELYGHGTCRETGALAAAANVRRLWLTHYSAAVTDPAPGLAAARTAYPAAVAGYDGLTEELEFDREP